MQKIQSWIGLLCVCLCTTAFVSQESRAAELRVLLNEGKRIGDTASLEHRFQMALAKLLLAERQDKLTFILRPRKRLTMTLENAEADLVCGYTPKWLPGNVDWSENIYSVVDVLVASQRVKAPLELAHVKGKTIGTILGYSYPEVEQVLGADFVRDDGPSAIANLKKLSIGRFDYAIVSKATLNFHLNRDEFPLLLHPPIVVHEFATQCAVSKNGRINVAELNQQIAKLKGDGSLNRLLKQYDRQ